MKKSTKIIFISFISSLVTFFVLSIMVVVIYDPYFHYHSPYYGKFEYVLNNQRYQNDGIIKHFDYDAMITGTSMTENFKASEADAIFGTNTIKVPYSGGSFKEINEAVLTGIKHNKDLKLVIRGLDCSMFANDSERMRTDLGEYPSYLYDDNPFNDWKYLFNHEVFESSFKYLFGIDKVQNEGPVSFDDYSYWHSYYKFGKSSVIPKGITNITDRPLREMTEVEMNRMKKNIQKNVVSTIESNNDIDFYLFITPYSAVYWRQTFETDSFNAEIQCEDYLISELSKYPNVKLVSLNDCFDITTDLNFYTNSIHYGAWINSFILECFKNDKHVVNLDNKDEYLQKFKDFYLNYNFETINEQDDYEDDEYAKTVLDILIEEGKI